MARFDYPMDTQIPYMKIGLDQKIDFNRFLSFWKSQTDLGTETYSCGLCCYLDRLIF